MGDRKRAAEEDSVDDEVIGPLPVSEKPSTKKQKGLAHLELSCALFRIPCSSGVRKNVFREYPISCDV